MNIFIQNHTTGQFLELHSAEVNYLRLHKIHEFCLLKVLQVLLQKQDPVLMPFLPQLQKFYTEFEAYCQKLKPYKAINTTLGTVFIPRKLLGNLDLEIAGHKVFTEVEAFRYFYETTQSLHAQWESIRQELKKDKNNLKQNLSKAFTEWDDKDYFFEELENAPKGTLSLHYQTDDGEVMPVAQALKWSQTIKNTRSKNPKLNVQHELYFETALELGFFNIYDALYALSEVSPLKSVVKYEVFNQPLDSYSLQKTQTFAIPQLTVYCLAVRDKTRIPMECWIRVAGQGTTRTIQFHDHIEKASCFTNLEDAQRELLTMYLSTDREVSIVAFQSTPKFAITSTYHEDKSTHLTQEFNTLIEKDYISNHIVNPEASNTFTQTYKI